MADADPKVEETAEAEVEEKPEVKEEPKEEVWEGTVSGKYNYDASQLNCEVSLGAAITKYGWSDGKKRVCVYVEMDGLDDVAESDLKVESTESTVTFTIAKIGSPPKARKLELKGLSNEIDGVEMKQKKGKNTVQLNLKKKEEQPWYKLLETSGGGGGGDDDEGGGGGMGGMGGMPGMGGMGGMGGGGGMGGMADMMGGMGGMGGGGGGGMDMAAMQQMMGGMGMGGGGP